MEASLSRTAVVDVSRHRILAVYGEKSARLVNGSSYQIIRYFLRIVFSPEESRGGIVEVGEVSPFFGRGEQEETFYHQKGSKNLPN